MCKGERWVYGDLRHYNCNPHTEKWTIHDPSTGLETDIDESTIGQFTGLYDKDGKEIYEGDIVKKHDPYNVWTSDYIGEVRWGKGRWKVPNFSFGCWFETDLYFDDFAGHKQKIIGNIFDNPALIPKR